MPRKAKNVTPEPAPNIGVEEALGIGGFDIPEGLLEELAPDRASEEFDVERERMREELPPPSDDLGDLAAQLVPLTDQLRATIADIALIPFASATPEQRTALVKLREQLDKPRRDLSTWVDAIDVSIRQAALDTQAKEFILADGKVTVEPPRGEWVVNVPSMQRELKELQAHGLVSDDDIASIITTEVITKANNAGLNQLAKKRGAQVAEAINRWRVWREGNPTSAKIRFERTAES